MKEKVKLSNSEQTGLSRLSNSELSRLCRQNDAIELRRRGLDEQQNFNLCAIL